MLDGLVGTFDTIGSECGEIRLILGLSAKDRALMRFVYPSYRERPCEDKKERMWVNREEGKNIEGQEKKYEEEAKEFQERKKEGKKRAIRSPGEFAGDDKMAPHQTPL